jgi:hypothetical protein
MSNRPAGLGRGVLALAIVFSLTLGSLLALATPVPATAQMGPFATADAVPGDAVVYSVIDLDLESAQWQQVEELLGRLGVPDALDQFHEEALTGAEDEPTEEEFSALLGGEAAFFVLPSGVESLFEQFEALNQQMAEMGMGTPGAAGGDMEMPAIELTGVGVVFEPSDPEVAWGYVERQLASQADSDDVQIEETVEGDVTIVTLTPSDPSEPEIVIANTGSFIVLAGNIIDVQTVIDTANGDADSVADTDAFNQIVGALPGESISFTFYDSTQVMGLFGEDFLEGFSSLSPELAEAAEVASFGGVAFWADADGFRMDAVTVPAEGSDLSAMVPDGTVTFDQRVPAETTVFFGGLVPPGTWDYAAFGVAQAINAGMTGEQPDMGSLEEMYSEEAIQEQLAQAEQILGFNLLDDFFSQFSGETAFAFTFPDMMAMGSMSIDTVFVTELEDPAVVAESVEKLVRMLTSMAGDQMPVTTESMGDDTLYVIGDPETTGVPAIEVGVIEGQLVIGTGAGVSGFMDGVSSSLADDAGYQDVLGLLPGENYYQVIYVDLADIIPTAMALSGGMAGGSGIEDADPACLEYDSQEEAQAAYDEDPFTNSNLDQDFDGQACEDLFNPPASPETPSGSIEALEAFASVSYEEDGAIHSSAILHVGEAGE